MNKFLLFFLTTLFSTGLFAQGSGRIGAHDAINRWTPSVPVSSFSNISEGRNIGQKIIDVVGLKANFEIREANIPNAAAVVYGGQRYVLYNPDFIRQLERSTGTQWAGVSVLAHEIGHHLNGHTITSSGSQPQLELESDEFSGFVLRKMGATLAEAQAAMKTLASVQASRTHPGQYDRLVAIANGWNKAGGQSPVNTDVASSPSSSPAATRSPQVPASGTARRVTIDSRSIIGDVRFLTDPGSKYYITNRYSLIRVRNNQLSTIGRLKSLNSRQYPYMIYDEANTQLLVDNRGNILTRQGRRVGVLSARS